MREVMIAEYCDRCFWLAGDKVPAEAADEIKVSGLQANVELCAGCVKSILEPVRELLDAVAERERLTRKLQEKAERDAARVNYKSHCGLCDTWIELRARTTHAREVHSVDVATIRWSFSEDVLRVVLCSCRLPFPTNNGLKAHVRYFGEGHAALEGTAEPNRPAKA